MRGDKTLLILVNVDWIFISHRLPIAIAAKNQGYRVVVAAKDTGKSSVITEAGLEFINIEIHRSSTKILKELKTLWSIAKLYITLKPNIVHHVTMKPVVYGSIIAKFLKIRVLNAISGLGYVFTDNRESRLQRIIKHLMRFAFRTKKVTLLFQNQDDYQQLKNLSIVTNLNEVYFIKGVGVDLNTYKSTIIKSEKKINILFPARLLLDKGLMEFINAAIKMQQNYEESVVFKICGKIDKHNPKGISLEQLQSLLIPNYLEWLGHQENMISIYNQADIVVLPSYREGMPKSLIEACAMGIPIVTTNAIGCKDCVDDGENGYLVPIKNVDELVNNLLKLIKNRGLRLQMGLKSRLKAEKEFDLKEVIAKHMAIYENILN